MSVRRIVFASFVLAMGLQHAGTSVCAQDPDYVLSASPVAGAAGTPQGASVLFDNFGGSVQGWTLGLCHDSQRAELVGVVDGDAIATANNGNPPDFHVLDVAAAGWTVGVVLDLMSTNFLPLGPGHELYRADYQMVLSADANLCFCDTLGSPPVMTSVLVAGAPVLPTTQCGVSVGPVAEFRRGDIDGNTSVGIGDAIAIITFLFQPGAAPPPDCMDSADFNDDGALDLPDIVSLLNYLFIPNFPSPLDPGPEQCGVDPTVDGFADCINSGC